MQYVKDTKSITKLRKPPRVQKELKTHLELPRETALEKLSGKMPSTEELSANFPGPFVPSEYRILLETHKSSCATEDFQGLDGICSDKQDLPSRDVPREIFRIIF